MARGSSPSFEGRLALVHEGVDALLLVFGGEEQVERLALELESRIQRRIPREVDRLGRETSGDGRLLSDRPRERFGVIEPRRGRVDLRGEADRLRLVGLDAPAGEDQLVRAVRSEEHTS